MDERDGTCEEKGEPELHANVFYACTGWNCYLSYVNSQGGKNKIADVLEKEK